MRIAIAIPRTRSLVGEKVFRWSVIEYVKGGYYLCRCECGTVKKVYGSGLRKGKTLSCGCYNKEVAGKAVSTHRMTRTRTYRIWAAMKARCFRTGSCDYANYGGRGITVCDRWLKFENFLADMGECQEGKSIDRIDNNGNYEPGNCRWATQVEQERNKRNNKILTHEGKSACISEWSDIVGIPQATISRRVRLGWSDCDALNVPVGATNKTWKLSPQDVLSIISLRKQGKTFRAIAEIFNVSDAAIRRQIKKSEACCA